MSKEKRRNTFTHEKKFRLTFSLFGLSAFTRLQTLKQHKTNTQTTHHNHKPHCLPCFCACAHSLEIWTHRRLEELTALKKLWCGRCQNRADEPGMGDGQAYAKCKGRHTVPTDIVVVAVVVIWNKKQNRRHATVVHSAWNGLCSHTTPPKNISPTVGCAYSATIKTTVPHIHTPTQPTAWTKWKGSCCCYFVLFIFWRKAD